MLSILKMSQIDQIHLRAVMLCMLKMSKMGKEHTDTFIIIPFTESGFRFSAFAYDGKRRYTHILAHNFLNI